MPYPEEEPDPEFDEVMIDLLRSMPPNLRSVFLATVPRQLNSTPLPLVKPVTLPDSTPLRIMVYVPSRLLHHFHPSFPADITEVDFRRISESECQKVWELMMMLGNRAAITCLVENIVGVDFNLTSHLVHGDAGSWGG
jgi:hypothetical protein